MNQLLKQLNVVRISKVISSQTVYVGHQLLFPLWKRALWSLTIRAQLLSKSSQFETEFFFSAYFC